MSTSKTYSFFTILFLFGLYLSISKQGIRRKIGPLQQARWKLSKETINSFKI